MKSWHKHLSSSALPVMLLITLFCLPHSAKSKTDRLIIQNGDSALSNEQAREQKEQWDATRSLRGKVITRAEKDFDKDTRAVDTRDACEQSLNVNAYWEPNTLRCLDRHSGRPVTP